ncbi:MAG: cytochrome C oxidase subunit IV family protein [Candidatus Binatia bacterium]
MKALIQSSATLVWAVLMLATGLSWWLGTHGAVTGSSSATITMLLVAFFKVRLVILYFMEIRDAPLPLKLACEGWVIVTCGAVLGFYLLA